MKRLATCTVLLLVAPLPIAHAAPHPLHPQPAATTATPAGPRSTDDPFVLSIKGEVRGLTFPEANLDGSFVDSGKELTFATDVFFESNKATLTSKADAVLDQAAARLKELNAAVLRVSGHTDSSGSTSHNQRLSQRRAQSVRNALRQRVSGLTIEARGYGESHPVADNHTARGRALNRRVAVTVLE